MILSVPEALLEERRRAGVDGRDEMWEGVLHMVPPPRGPHQRLSTDVLYVCIPLARRRGLVPHVETGVFRADDDYKVPDQAFALPAQLSDRGIEGGPPLVFEFRSPGDETYDKLGWYWATGVQEVLVVHPDTRLPEVFVRGEAGMVRRPGTPVRLETLGVELSVVDGPQLRLVWEDGSAEV